MFNSKYNIWFKDYVCKNKSFFRDKKNLNLTIIIFTFQRPECIIKSAAYWANRPLKVIIIDGSTQILNKSFRKTLKKIRNISYYHLPNKSISERIKFGSNKSKTKFTMCQGDDDFYLFSGLIESVKKFKKNSSIVASMGQSVGLDYMNNKPYLFEYGENLKGYNIINRNVVRRLDYAFKNYIPAAFYAVFKTKVFKRLWKNIKTSSCLELYEYEHALKTYLEGSLITTKKKYWVRSFQQKPQISKIDGNRKLTFSEWLSNKKFSPEKKILIRHLSNAIQKKTILKKQESKELVCRIFDLIRFNKNSLYQNNSRFLSIVICFKKLIEISFFSKCLKKFKNSNYGIILIQKLNYLSRKKIMFSKQIDRVQEAEIKKLLEFLNNCPI